MRPFSRRKFLKNSSLAMAGVAFSNSAFGFKNDNFLLSFSTLGCPKWSLTEILNFANGNGYDGIEIRGLLGELDLTKCPDFGSTEKISSVKKMLEEKQLRIVNLGASAELHHPNGEKRKSNLDGAKKFIDLAQKLDCPFIRVFPNALPKDQDRNITLDLISKGLLELGDFAKGSKVSVLLETHGDVVETNDVLRIMKNSESAQVGLIWDIFNMWSVTKEPPTQVYEKLNKYIQHTHIKDAKLINGEWHYVLLGQGEAPVQEAVKALVQGKYKGFYCFEWEKLWHPDIEEPEIAIAAYPKQMKKYY
ncbi:MAG: sugar phosphate isomerase/epimerase family protein [Bacteroidota bacterium]